MTSTPRTDQHEEAWIRYWASEDIDRETPPKEWADFARELERENARLGDSLKITSKRATDGKAAKSDAFPAT